MPKIPIGATIEAFIDFLVTNFAFLTIAFTRIMENVIRVIENGFLFLPPWLFILAATGLTFWLTRKRGIALFTLLGLALIWNMGLWVPTISTITLVLIATLTALSIAIPIGILAALHNGINRLVQPVLDVMQTMPAFVYLIPAIPFFGLGKVAAIFATVIFSMPPAIRLTCLGIKQVPRELVECADAFGSTKWQKLFKLQLPLATPTIMAGVNQTVMLGLSMVVIAAMIGARGLGGEVWRAIQRLQMGNGFEAGLGIVIVAIILDRVLQHFGTQSKR
ncbi:glycine betaine/proline transport system permease protein [Desulfonatronum thiosulfatophilum]|uniref:Glycine betaine/proline transport system permease protein n=1 Tax=Desulfonatronum thiosulfatophilum TaxID=617002 RepID=A0A1G6BPF4_9BACT|nr:proline/glycine betaine ABC transporter permease [Desulfonatronum thiosulfatophilum]SDB22524.1 glycine betaine/proline transport system permease protein [Desulfonatronum thiosulfatophilum]